MTEVRRSKNDDVNSIIDYVLANIDQKKFITLNDITKNLGRMSTGNIRDAIFAMIKSGRICIHRGDIEQQNLEDMFNKERYEEEIKELNEKISALKDEVLTLNFSNEKYKALDKNNDIDFYFKTLKELKSVLISCKSDLSQHLFLTEMIEKGYFYRQVDGLKTTERGEKYFEVYGGNVILVTLLGQAFVKENYGNE